MAKKNIHVTAGKESKKLVVDLEQMLRSKSLLIGLLLLKFTLTVDLWVIRKASYICIYIYIYIYIYI